MASLNTEMIDNLPVSPFGTSLTNRSTLPTSGIRPEAEAGAQDFMGFDPGLPLPQCKLRQCLQSTIANGW
jgi:hypothetical protein